MTDELTGREAVPSVTASGSAGAPGAVSPRPAWIILGLGWEHNDEFSYEEGVYPQKQIYFDKAQADTECQRLYDEFFAETPEDFDVHLEAYQHALPDDVDETTVTWEQLRAAGFPKPYYVVEMEA